MGRPLESVYKSIAEQDNHMVVHAGKYTLLLNSGGAGGVVTTGTGKFTASEAGAGRIIAGRNIDAYPIRRIPSSQRRGSAHVQMGVHGTILNLR